MAIGALLNLTLITWQIIPYGSGTSLEGNAVPIQESVILNFVNMDRILRVNAEDMDVEVEVRGRNHGLAWTLRPEIDSRGFLGKN